MIFSPSRFGRLSVNAPTLKAFLHVGRQACYKRTSRDVCVVYSKPCQSTFARHIRCSRIQQSFLVHFLPVTILQMSSGGICHFIVCTFKGLVSAGEDVAADHVCSTFLVMAKEWDVDWTWSCSLEDGRASDSLMPFRCF